MINRTVQPRAGILEASMKNLIYDGPLGVIIKSGLEAVGSDMQEIEEANIESVKLQANGDFKALGDMKRIPVDYLQKLKAECHVAVALSLLLRLKRHIKFTFGLNDARCQAFSPTEPIKSGDVLLRQNIPFIIKDIHTAPPRTLHQMLQQYEVLKRSLKEDTVDYTYSASTARKRTRSVPAQEDRSKGNIQPDVPLSTRSLRRKSLFTSPKHSNDGTSESECEDDRNQQKRRQLRSSMLKRKR
jgi:cohesin loading factor subunit SCC2